MLETLIGAGLSGLGSLLSGFGAKDSAEDQQARQEAYDAAARERVKNVTNEYRKNVPTWLIEDADKAGFNPVTWLNGGALGWYGTQLSGLVSSYGNATQAINIPSSMSAMGGAISSFAGAFQQGSQFDRKLNLEYAALDQQGNIAAMKYGGRYGAAGQNADAMFAFGGGNSPIYSAGSRAGAVTGGGVSSVTAGLSPSRKSELSDWTRGYEPFINKGPDKDAAPSKIFSWITPYPHLPSANAVENEYGEVGGDFYGIGKGVADTGYSIFKTKPVQDMTNFFSTRRPSDVIKEIPFFHNPGNVPAIGMGM